MEQEMIRISRPLVEQLIDQLDRSATFCEKARSFTQDDMHDTQADATEFYAGSSGYARATMRDILQTLESHLD